MSTKTSLLQSKVQKLIKKHGYLSTSMLTKAEKKQLGPSYGDLRALAIRNEHAIVTAEQMTAEEIFYRHAIGTK